jgi:ribulose bisphosphate carboxylase small subunit
MNKRIDQYIIEYEELDSDEDDQDTNDELIKEMKALMIDFLSFLSFFEKDNAETFIIIFESMKNLEMMITDLINRSLSHYLIDFHTDMNDQIIDHLQICLKKGFSIIIVHTDMKNINSDSFLYVMIFDRYISDKFYKMMIDSNASTKSTAEYEQYLAFNKINSTIDLNLFRAETVNVQFEIESASSIESLTIDISFEIVKFHVVKTDISFLLSLADMNRLKVYFNNVTNSLIQMIKTSDEILRKKRSFSVIRRFDHEFLL